MKILDIIARLYLLLLCVYALRWGLWDAAREMGIIKPKRRKHYATQ